VLTYCFYVINMQSREIDEVYLKGVMNVIASQWFYYVRLKEDFLVC
jgi:hypothetical protein